MFRYTDNGKYLTTKQRRFYEDNGYIIVKKLVDDDLLDECRARYDQICEKGATTKDMIVMKEQTLKHTNVEGKHLIKNLQQLMNDSVFVKYASYEPILDVVESIIGPNINCCHSMMLSKPPNAHPESSKHPLHQDYFYMPFTPAHSLVTVWTATEYSDTNNGAIYVLPGTHKTGLLHHEYSSNANRGYYEVKNYKGDGEPVHLVVEKGDTIFFNHLILHGSSPNYTKTFRTALLCIYIDANCDILELKGTPQEELADLMYKSYKLTDPHIKSYSDAWITRSKVMRGNPGKLQNC